MSNRDSDVTGRPFRLFLFYGLPVVAIMNAGQLAQTQRDLGLIIAAALAVMGGTCVANAWKCRRTHCFFTGPWFLLAAGASLLKGFGLIPWEFITWNVIGLGGPIGALVLWCGSESLLGRFLPDAKT